MQNIKPNTKLILVLAGVLLIALVGIQSVLAQSKAEPASQVSPIHPTFALLDANGENVLASGNAVSTMKTCGQCHDTDFIASHAFHSDLGLSAYQPVADSMNSSN